MREAGCFDVFPPDMPRPRVEACGGHPGRAADLARRLLDGNCDALMSFGICGGLDPMLATGAIIIGTKVIAADGSAYDTDSTWVRALSLKLSARCPHVSAPVYGSSGIITNVATKKKIFADTGASVVDRESHVIAAVAKEREVPFIAVRAVADSAKRRIPSAALYGIREDGTTRPLAVLAALMIRPWQAPGLGALALDTYGALGALRRVASLTDATFALG